MEALSELDFESRRIALMLLKEKKKRASRRHLWDFYPEEGPLRRDLYPKHMRYFEAGATYRERVVIAANRVGKTEGITGYELALHLTGRYPNWWVGRRFTRPIKAWAAGTTAETTRDILQRKLLGPLDNLGTGLIPYDDIVGEPKRDSGIPECVETATIRHTSGGVSKLQFKAYKQGRKSFEGDEIDVVLLDEECPSDIYTECLIRTMTTHGIVMLGFTPLEGLSETVLLFMPGGTIPAAMSNGKFIIGATWDDAPHLSQQDKDELWAAIPPYQRDARSKGTPTLGSGAIFPVRDEDIVVSDFLVPDYWPQAYGFDVGWNCTAAVWGAHDRTNDIVYITSCYKRGQAEPESHARAIISRGEWIPGVADPAAQGSSQKDGTKLMDEYMDLGLDLSPADNTVEAGLFELYKRMTTGRFKVFRSCAEWFEEKRVYRRDKHGKVVKVNDHLMDTTRYYIMSGLEVERTKPTARWTRNATVTQIMDTVPLGRCYN